MMTPETLAYLTNGGFAVLFVWLLIDTRRDSRQREEKLMAVINKQATANASLAVVLKEIGDKMPDHNTIAFYREHGFPIEYGKTE